MPKLYVKTVTGWEEIAKRGIQGLEGERGRPGKDGKDSKVPGPPGPPGKDGKDASPEEMRMIAEVKARDAVKEHEDKCNHDPFIVGSKKLSEAGMQKGMFLQYDGERLKYATISQVASQVKSSIGRGLSLPSQSGNSGKFLTTDGNRASWATVAGGSGITRSISSISSDTTAGATADTDYVYLISGTTTLTLPTAVGNTNLYTAKNIGVGTATIAFTGGQTADGSATIAMSVANTSLSFISDNLNWRIV